MIRQTAPTKSKSESHVAFLFRSIDYYTDPDRRRMGQTHAGEMTDSIKALVRGESK